MIFRILIILAGFCTLDAAAEIYEPSLPKECTSGNKQIADLDGYRSQDVKNDRLWNQY